MIKGFSPESALFSSAILDFVENRLHKILRRAFTAASNSPYAIGRPYYALTRPRGTEGYARLMTTTGVAGGCVFSLCGLYLLRLPAEHSAHGICGFLLCSEVQVGVNICCCCECAVSQPDLNLLHRDSAAEKQAGAGVSDTLS